MLLKSASCKDRSHCVATFSSVPDRENNISDRENNIPDGESNTPDIPTNLFYFTSLADAQLINPNIQVATFFTVLCHFQNEL